MTQEQLYEIFEDVEQHRIYCKEQFADAILALPLDVPSDEEMNMENAKETPLQDLMKDALDHYNEAGNAISHHRNDVYLAIEQYYKLKMEKEKGIDKNWIMEILDKTNAFAKQLIEDHFNRHKIEVYSRPECPFKYCDDPETCKKLGKCHNT